MSASSLPSVLVLDAQTRQALAVCRALGRAGFEVGAASGDRSALSRSSRHVTRFHHVEPDARTLAALVRQHRYRSIVACEDPTVALLAAEPPDVPTIPHLDASLDRLTDKLLLSDTAASAGVAYPTTMALAEPADLAVAFERFGSPMIVKASRSAAVRAGTAVHRSGARVVHDLPEAERAVAWIATSGLTPIAQQRIDRADKIDVAVVRGKGTSEVRLAYRVLRDVPLTGGLAVSIESIRSDVGVGSMALDALERVLDGAGYEGIANAEFCLSGDGTITLIEVNARVWASIWFAEQLGLRVVERCLRKALALPGLASARPVAAGRRYRNPAGELDWVRRHDRRMRPFLAVVRDLPRRSTLEYVDLTDPRPPLALGLDKLRALLRRRSTP